MRSSTGTGRGGNRDEPRYLLDSNVLVYTLDAREPRFSYYDAQVWAVARLGQVPVVLSEDFNPGAVIGGVSFVDPFHPAFDLSALD